MLRHFGSGRLGILCVKVSPPSVSAHRRYSYASHRRRSQLRRHSRAGRQLRPRRGERTYYWSHDKGHVIRTEVQTGVSDGQWSPCQRSLSLAQTRPHEIELKKEALVARYGRWTAHNIELGDAIYTIGNRIGYASGNEGTTRQFAVFTARGRPSR